MKKTLMIFGVFIFCGFLAACDCDFAGLNELGICSQPSKNKSTSTLPTSTPTPTPTTDPHAIYAKDIPGGIFYLQIKDATSVSATINDTNILISHGQVTTTPPATGSFCFFEKTAGSNPLMNDVLTLTNFALGYSNSGRRTFKAFTSNVALGLGCMNQSSSEILLNEIDEALGNIASISFNSSTNALVPISLGYEHSCVLTSGGGVKCWGRNFYGQIGDNTRTDRLIPVEVSSLSSGVKAISSGRLHTCALTNTGGVKCWGTNLLGVLGNGSTTDSLIPADVSGLSSGITVLSSRMGWHACALTNSGGVKCWGGNQYGQIGDNTTANKLTPVDVSGLSSGITVLSSGSWHSCALTNIGGVKCWGNNGGGQLGDNTFADRSTPVEVSGLSSGITALSLGGNHTCALTNTGGVKCWGKNDYGQLGNDSASNSLTPVNVSGLSSGITVLSSGFSHSCVLTDTGGVKCWGKNDYGQLGDGSNTNRYTPVDVSGLPSGIIALSSGGDHNCILTNTGVVKCWGMNNYGQLGDNTTTNRNTPVSVVQ